MSNHDVYFVGTIPLDRTVDVFSSLAELIGERAQYIPDGELGDRKLWVSSQYPILATCPALEPMTFPSEGLTRQHSYELPLTLKKNVSEKDFTFSDLGYAKHAIASFALFDAMQKANKIPQSWIFQINLPAPMDVMSMIMPNTRAAIEGPYSAAMLKELQTILEALPHDRIAISWDVVRAVLFWEDPNNTYFTSWFDDPIQGSLKRLIELGKAVPSDVRLGYHLCYGSQDHKHAMEPKDLGACIGLINAVAAALDRPINFVHMPVPRDRTDEAFYAPLAGLTPTIAKLYLGLVHMTDGVEGSLRRIRVAEKFRKEFGLATECGFGRRPSAQDVKQLIALHAQLADS